MSRLFVAPAFALLAALLPPLTAAAGDVAAGEEKSQPCALCHGTAGNAPTLNHPKLAAQNEKYLLYTLRAYKDGSRPNAIMAAQLANLSDEDLADLAAYYAAQAGELEH